jgi:hypothetical protein
MAAEQKREIKSDWLIYEQIESDWLLIPIYFVVCIDKEILGIELLERNKGIKIQQMP